MHGTGESWKHFGHVFSDPSAHSWQIAGAVIIFFLYLYTFEPLTFQVFVIALSFGAFFLICPYPVKDWTGYFGLSYMWIPVLFTGNSLCF